MAQVRVINNGTPSNVITSYMNLTAPGAFTIPPGGIGSTAALHVDYSLVTADNQARVGETLVAYVSGLGSISPAVPEGEAAPASPLNETENRNTVNVDGVAAPVTFAGLASRLAGLFHVNFEVPSGIRAGTVTVDISGPDSYNSQAEIPVAEGNGTVPPSAARSFIQIRRPLFRSRLRSRPMPEPRPEPSKIPGGSSAA